MNDFQSKTRLIAKLVRDVATCQRFESYSDLKDALRRRLVQLHVRYQQQEFDDAVSLVTSNAVLWRTPRPARTPTQTAAPTLSRTDAKQLYDDLCRRYRAQFAQKHVS